MPDSKFVLLDNSNYAAYYLENLKDAYAPIVLREQTRAYFESKGASCIGIFDFLNSSDLKDATKKALAASDALITEMDRVNGKNYTEMFGIEGIKLFRATADFLFKRFVISAFRMVKGLESILANRKVSEIAYLHDGNPSDICGTYKERGFFFRDDVAWDILQNWQSNLKPRLIRINAVRCSGDNELFARNKNHSFQNKIRTIKVFLSPFKGFFLSLFKHKGVFDKEKKNLLFLYPFYDFSSLLKDESLMSEFNVFTWSPEDKKSNRCKNTIAELDFTAQGFENSGFADNLDSKDLLLPLLKRFYEKKIPDILCYWSKAKGIHDRYKIDMLLWGNPPHRYPAGILKEFFRINKVPVCGMQHGGLNGSNFMGKLLFETEFNSSDYYFSYGFTQQDLEGAIERHSMNLTSRIIPVGSVCIDRFLKDFHKPRLGLEKQKVDIIFPIAVVNQEFFYDFEENNPWLFKLQKKIVDLLAVFRNKKIVLKFPVGNYSDSPLGIYIEQKYPNRFRIIDHISFSEYLKVCDANTIIIERQSTPLNEAILTESNIVIYNNVDWCGLTAKAHRLLSKRAVVCDDEEEFFSAIRDCLEGRPGKRDISNREFMQDYCIYKGNPGKNIKKGISSILSYN